MEYYDILILVFGCIASYLFGGISIARIITRKKNKSGIETEGSGNPGTMNMLRSHGILMGLFTLLCDALKGVLPALFGLLYFGEQYYSSLGYLTLYLFGFFAVIGHIFPIYYKFKGGKGIATTFGVFLVADPITTVILFAILFVGLYFIKIGSVISLLFITINLIVQFFKPYAESWITIVLMCCIVVLDIWAHRENFLRLIENRENAADLAEGLQKDIEKIRNKKERKLNKVSEKHDKIVRKYDNKIIKKHEKVTRKIERLTLRKNENEDTGVEKLNNVSQNVTLEQSNVDAKNNALNEHDSAVQSDETNASENKNIESKKSKKRVKNSVPRKAIKDKVN